MARMSTRHSSPLLRTIPVLLGIVGMLGAVVLGAMGGQFLPWHYAMGGLGMLSVFGGLLWQNDASFRDTLASVAYTFFFAGSCIFLFFISGNREWHLDITRDRIFTLSPQSVGLLRSLPRDAQLRLVWIVPRDSHSILAEWLSLYRREFPNLSFELLDPDLDLGMILQVDQAPALHDLTIFRMLPGEEIRRDKINIKPDAPARERLVTNTIASVSFGRGRTVYFTRDHGELPLKKPAEGARGLRSSLSRFAEYLKENRMEAKELRLLQGIPDDATMIVVAGPTKDFFDYERDALLEFVRGGGDLLLLFDPVMTDDGELENLKLVLEEVGLTAYNVVIIDPETASATQNPFTPAVKPTGKHAITAASSNRPFLLRDARPVFFAPEVPDSASVEVILATASEQTWARSREDLRGRSPLERPSSADEIGARAVGMASHLVTPGGSRGEDARIVAIGDADLFTDDFISNESMVFGLAILNWLAEREEMLDVPPRMIRGTPARVDRTIIIAMAGAFLAIGLGIGAGGTALALARRRRR